MAVQGLTLPSNARGMDMIPGWGAKIPHASWPPPPQIIKQKQYCKKFSIKTKKMVHIKKIIIIIFSQEPLPSQAWEFLYLILPIML